MSIGVFFTYARGPWLVAAFVGAIAIALGSRNAVQMIKILLRSDGGRRLRSSLSPLGAQIIDTAAVHRHGRSGAVEQRQALAETSWRLVQQNPWFGNPFVLLEMEHLRTGRPASSIWSTAIRKSHCSTGSIGLALFHRRVLRRTQCLCGVQVARECRRREMVWLGASLIAVHGRVAVLMATSGQLYLQWVSPACSSATPACRWSRDVPAGRRAVTGHAFRSRRARRREHGLAHSNVIPFLDLKSVYESSRRDIDAALLRVAASGSYLHGHGARCLRSGLRALLRRRHCVGVANGLDALHLGLLALGVGAGDEVIVPSNTYIATWLAVSRCGARVVPVEPVEAHVQHRPGADRGGDLVAYQGDHSGASLWPAGRHGSDHRASRASTGCKVLDDCAQAHGGALQGPPGRLARRAVGMELLSRQEPRRVRRCRRGDRRRRRARRAGAGARQLRLARQVPQRSQGLQLASRRDPGGGSRGQARGSASERPSSGARSRRDTWQACATFRLRCRTCRRSPSRPGICSSSGTRDRDASRSAARARHRHARSTIPCRRICSPPTPNSAGRRARFPSAEAIHAEVLSLPMWPGIDDAPVEQVIDAVRACA